MNIHDILQFVPHFLSLETELARAKRLTERDQKIQESDAKRKTSLTEAEIKTRNERLKTQDDAEIEKRNQKLNEFAEKYKTCKGTFSIDEQKQFLTLLLRLCRPKEQEMLMILGEVEAGKEIFNLFKKEDEERAKREEEEKRAKKEGKEPVKASASEEMLLPPELIIEKSETETVDLEESDGEESDSEEEIENKPTTYGFKLSTYEEILPLAQLAHLFEKNGDPANHAYKLTKIFENKEEIIQYLQSSVFKDAEHPVHRACFFSLPDDAQMWNLQGWRKLAVKDNNLISQKFKDILPNAAQIEGPLFKMVLPGRLVLAKNAFFDAEKTRTFLDHEILELLVELFPQREELVLVKEDFLKAEEKRKLLNEQKEILLKTKGSLIVIGEEQSSEISKKLDELKKQIKENKKSIGVQNKEIAKLSESLQKKTEILLKEIDKLIVTPKGQELCEADKKIVALKKMITEKNASSKTKSKEIAALNGKIEDFESIIFYREHIEILSNEIPNLTGDEKVKKENLLKMTKESLAKKEADFLADISVSELHDIYLKQAYVHAEEDLEAARVLKECRLTDRDFDYWLSLVPKNSDKAIPPMVIKGSDIHPNYSRFYLKKVEKEINGKRNPRNGVEGCKTGCCQHIGAIDTGEQCAVHSITSPLGGVYAVYKGDGDNPKDDDELLTIVWGWRGTEDGLVFDSMEFNETRTKHVLMFANLYTLLAHRLGLMNEHNIPRVMLGADGQTPACLFWGGEEPRCQCEPLEQFKDYKGYNDSSENQLVLARPDVPGYLYARVIGNAFYDPIKKCIVMTTINGAYFFPGYASQEEADFMLQEIKEVNEFWKKEIKKRAETLTEFTRAFKTWVASCIALQKTDILTAFREVLPIEKQTVFDMLVNVIKDVREGIKNEFAQDNPDFLKIVQMVKQSSAGLLDIPLDFNTGNTILLATCFRILDCWGGQTIALEEVQLLIEGGASVDIRNYKGDNVLAAAIQKNNIGLVKILVTHGANLNLKDTNGNTAIISAIEYGHWEVAAYIAQQTGIDWSATNNQDKTALILIAEQRLGMLVNVKPFAVEIVRCFIKGNQERAQEQLQTENLLNEEDENKNTAVMLAANTGNTEIVQILVESGADLNIQNVLGNTAVMLAANTGNTEIVQILVEGGADLNVKNKSGQTAFTIANFSDFEIVLYLAEKMKEPLNDEYKTFAFGKAAEEGKVKVVESLIKEGIDVDARDENNITALMRAVIGCHKEIVHLLTKNGANFGGRNYWWKGLTAFMLAIETGDLEMIQFFIEKKVDLRLVDFEGNNSLMLALKSNHLHVATFLIGITKDFLHEKNNKGQTPLMITIEEGSVDKVQLLVQMGSDLSIKNEEGDTILLFAMKKEAQSDKYRQIVQLLIQAKGFDLDARDKDGNTALSIAVSRNEVEIIKQLVENKADVNNIMLYLMYVRKEVNIMLIKYFVEHGADLNAKNAYGQTALTLAIERGNAELVRLLVELGANDITAALKRAISGGNLEIIQFLESRGGEVNGTLCTMVNIILKHRLYGGSVSYPDDEKMFSNQWEIIRFLVQKGVNVDEKNEEGNTALMLAVKAENIEVVEYLIKAGADVNAQNPDQDTVLFLALKRLEYFYHCSVHEALFKIIKLFLQQEKLDLAFKDKKGNTGQVLMENLSPKKGSDPKYTQLWTESYGYLRENKNRAFLAKKDENGDTVFIKSIRENNLHAVGTCFNGIDPSFIMKQKDRYGNTPLMVAVMSEPKCDHYYSGGCSCKDLNYQIIKRILLEPVDLNAKNNEGDTVFMIALRVGKLDWAQSFAKQSNLGENGAKIAYELTELLNQNNTAQKSPMLVMFNGMTSKIRTTSKTMNIEVLLFQAVCRGKLEIVRYFAQQQNVDLNVKDGNGNTPLMLAIQSSQLLIAEYLAKHPAVKLEEENQNKETALMMASKNNQSDIIKLLTKTEQAVEKIILMPKEAAKKTG